MLRWTGGEARKIRLKSHTVRDDQQHLVTLVLLCHVVRGTLVYCLSEDRTELCWPAQTYMVEGIAIGSKQAIDISHLYVIEIHHA